MTNDSEHACHADAAGWHRKGGQEAPSLGLTTLTAVGNVNVPSESIDQRTVELHQFGNALQNRVRLRRCIRGKLKILLGL